jgi:RNA polymerase sigma-70 factor (ECF subfamily)
VESSQPKNKALIETILAGNKEKFALIINDHKDLVYSILLRMTDDHEEANDLAQEVFIKVYKQLKQFKGNSKLSTWIFKITYFHGLSYLRKNKRWFTDVHKENVISDDNIENDLAEEELKGHLSESINKLKPLERTAITLFYLEELSVKDVAEIMNISESYVKVTVHRAKKNLKGLIKKEYYEGVTR